MATTVCIIDDDDLARARMGQMLQAEGFLVLEAENARLGLQIVTEQAPDVVLIDLIMPDQDGIEAIAEFRRRWPEMPIVAISGGGRIGPSLYLELARGLGATACLSKPLSMDLFKEAIGLDDQADASNATSR
ncbi:MAG TPA: response regulator [Caulobacteraceae bacterium]|jgi:CheY-like chemotaxis protein|nr:response regulator [Caulobacteraceae bacterium]